MLNEARNPNRAWRAGGVLAAASGLLCLSWLGLFPPVAATLRAATPIVEDCEIGDTSSWIGSPGFAATRDQARSGIFSFLSHTTPSQASSSVYWHAAAPLPDPVYFRFHFYVPSRTFTIPPSASVRLASLMNASDWSHYRLLLKNAAGKLVLGADHAPDGKRDIARDVWHAAELVYHRAAGTVSVSLDGIPETRAVGLNLGLKHVPNIGQESGGGLVYGDIFYDDISVGAAPSDSGGAAVHVRRPSSFARSGLPLLITLTGWGRSDQLSVRFDGREVFRQAGGISGRMYAHIDLSRLSGGSYPLAVVLLDANGAEKAQWTENVLKYGDGVGAVALDAFNNLLVNGVKTFPVMPFLLSARDFTATWYPQRYVNQGGWGTDWRQWYRNSDYREYLDAIRSAGARNVGPGCRAGLTADLSTQCCNTGLPWCGAKSNHPRAIVTDYVTSLKDHDGVLMWSWEDEPELNVAGSEHGGANDAGPDGAGTMRALMNETHAHDTNHPVALNLYGYDPVRTRLAGYLWPEWTADVYSFDYYPAGARHKGATFTEFVAVTDRFQQYTFGLTPWFSVIEASGAANPAPQQMRSEVWLSIIHGIKGISWWHPWAEVPAENLAEMASITKTIEHLTPAILADPTGRTVQTNQTARGARVDAMVRQTPGYIWVFAARLTDFGEENQPPLATGFTVSGMTGSQTAVVYGENRTVPVVNGVFTDAFAPFAVHIYQIPYGPAAPILENVQVK